MFEVKPRAVEKKESSTETDEGLGSSGKTFGSMGSGSADSGSVYLSDSQDWAVSPGCSPDDGTGQLTAISPMLAEETFRYMTYLALEPSSHSHPGSQSLSKVLSGDRVEQMTKAYNDIDVVSHLLAERDRDLELAARIGQSLLQRNHLLQERNEAIEEQLAQTVDQVHQLQHELSKKDELLRMVASASEERETDSSVSPPLRQPPALRGNTTSSTLSQLENLQSKLQDLEEENLALRSEACQLKTDTITYEEKEQQLVSDCVKELRESNGQIVSLTDELSHKNEDLLRHQEEIAQLLSQIVELQHRVKELALEKEELRIHLQASKESQRQLTAELDELADRNAECLEMLHESQEEIRELRNKNTPSAGMRRHLSYGLYPMDSLAAEIEGTMRRELSVDEETVSQDQRLSQRRVFQTVRSINSSSSRPASATPPIPGSGQSSLVMTAQPFQSNQGEEVRIGQPGCPGGNDLNRALHRLSLRRQNFMCERRFFQAEREKKMQALSETDGESSGCVSPMGSNMSSFSNLSELSFSSSVFRTFLPEKLQIVKPMEGSLTLHHWQQLAQPHLATILDPHPGVVTKGFCPLAQDAVYNMSDMEEDEEGEERRSKQEKGAAERGKEEEEEEEEGGITFKVRVSSSPNDRKYSVSPLPVPPPSPELPSPSPSSSVKSDLRVTHLVSSQSAQPITGTCATVVQSQSQICISTTTTSSIQNPGKCQSSTFSTYTFTTCSILHPSDVTQVTSSSQSSIMANTPSSMRTGPSTPVTPCRLSLGDCFPPRRPLVPARGLAKLVLERGISAQISIDTPPPSPKATSRQPLFRLLPGTPPNSPSHSRSPSPVPHESRQHPADNFLVSRPAELFLQDVYGLNLGRAPHPDLPSPSQEAPARAPSPKLGRPRPDLGLVERLRRLGFTKVLQGSKSDASAPRQDCSTFISAGGGSLLDGLRRNQSLPAMIGARAAKSNPTLPPPHPTTLALPPSPWGNPKERRRHLGSVSHVPSSKR
ncbi:trafficking kinesin-binding protein 2 isoform X1 [Pseudochaenichthys georgianus]|uniref:trafficking kinesin-binding protein 2 isoform X1 n=1 Tax=Pseudochaenichthys georgianus TaxID=52239 RepID=UPI00146EE796|nr:trafficking kinesin-binding protein 2 isoform X1 [Pseudochaenichthys georgianus]